MAARGAAPSGFDRRLVELLRTSNGELPVEVLTRERARRADTGAAAGHTTRTQIAAASQYATIVRNASGNCGHAQKRFATGDGTAWRRSWP